MNQVDRMHRSLLKTVTFRVLVVLLDAIIVFAFTRRYDLTLGFVVLSNVPRTVLYFLHERLWARTEWGRGDIRRR